MDRMNMIEKEKNYLLRYRSEVIYIVVGGLTTLVNFVVYLLAGHIIGLHYLAANVIAWVAAVLFAYVANRTWVFQSRNTNIILELWLFVLSRVFSLVLESGLLFIAVAALHINDVAAKIVIAFVVVVCNYITGKWIVFKKRK